MVFMKLSELESHLDVGEHRQVRGGSETVYDKIRGEWAEKFLTVDNNEETGRALVVHSDEQSDKNEASGSCSDLLGWALHKPRGQAVRFTDEVKQQRVAEVFGRVFVLTEIFIFGLFNTSAEGASV